jgi:hypothetical protein
MVSFGSASTAVSDDANARAPATAAASRSEAANLRCGRPVTGSRELEVEGLVTGADVGWPAMSQPASISAAAVATARIWLNGGVMTASRSATVGIGSTGS